MSDLAPGLIHIRSNPPASIKIPLKYNDNSGTYKVTNASADLFNLPSSNIIRSGQLVTL